MISVWEAGEPCRTTERTTETYSDADSLPGHETQVEINSNIGIRKGDLTIASELYSAFSSPARPRPFSLWAQQSAQCRVQEVTSLKPNTCARVGGEGGTVPSGARERMPRWARICICDERASNRAIARETSAHDSVSSACAREKRKSDQTA